jgi:hypothetical protein
LLQITRFVKEPTKHTKFLGGINGKKENYKKGHKKNG